MISLPCSHCKTTLQIDEAFAGGVCRCQHCGTIQTVPGNLKKGDSGPSGKTLYKNPHRGDSHVGTGLQNLNEEAPAPQREERKNRAKRAAAPHNPDAPSAPVPQWKLYAACAGIALVGILVIYLLLFHTR